MHSIVIELKVLVSNRYQLHRSETQLLYSMSRFDIQLKINSLVIKGIGQSKWKIEWSGSKPYRGPQKILSSVFSCQMITRVKKSGGVWLYAATASLSLGVGLFGSGVHVKQRKENKRVRGKNLNLNST